MQFRKKLLFSMVAAICKFGIIIILPNNSWLSWCFRSVKLAVYAVHAQCMQRHASTAIRCWACGQSSPARAGVWCVFRSAFPGARPPLPPRGCRKNGRPLTGRAIRYDTQPFETSRQTSSRSTQVQRKFNALRFPRLSNRACQSRYFIHFLVTCI